MPAAAGAARLDGVVVVVVTVSAWRVSRLNIVEAIRNQIPGLRAVAPTAGAYQTRYVQTVASRQNVSSSRRVKTRIRIASNVPAGVVTFSQRPTLV